MAIWWGREREMNKVAGKQMIINKGQNELQSQLHVIHFSSYFDYYYNVINHNSWDLEWK